MKGLQGLAEAYVRDNRAMIELVDVPSGWIHFPATYLEEGQRNVKTFGVKNVTQEAVDVGVRSDLGERLVFWLDKGATSHGGAHAEPSTSLNIIIPPSTTMTISLAFLTQANDIRCEVYGSSSIHSSISIRARDRTLTLPFFANVCRSLFTASLIDPTGLAPGPQQSSGQLVLDFGSEPVVGQVYHRDIFLVNRSEIELVWTTAVVSARFKDAVWFSLRDLDSENVFGVDQSSQPVPLPALFSRHLRLELRVKEPIEKFDFDFIISNAHGSGNVVTCRAVGSGQGETDVLKMVSTVDFGQICDGVWAKKLVTVKNAGEKAMDMKLSATAGHEVVFRLADVAGEDPDEVPARRRSPSPTFGLRSERSVHTSESSRRDMSLPPTRPLSRVTSTSSYRWHTDATESDDDEPESFPEPLASLVNRSEVAAEKPSNQIEDLVMRPGVEYRIFIFYRPAHAPGPQHETGFEVFLDFGSRRRAIACTAQSCTSFIEISNQMVDYGEVTIGDTKTATITINNLSALSAKVQMAAISKVLSVNRNVIVIPPFESKEEKVDFFPRRINERYEKQVFVRNLLNRPNGKLFHGRADQTKSRRSDRGMWMVSHQASPTRPHICGVVSRALSARHLGGINDRQSS